MPKQVATKMEKIKYNAGKNNHRPPKPKTTTTIEFELKTQSGQGFHRFCTWNYNNLIIIYCWLVHGKKCMFLPWIAIII